MALPERGSLVWLEFSPRAGSEQSSHRPAIVLTTRPYQRKSHLAVVCPITSRRKGWPLKVPLPEGLTICDVVLIDQVKSVDRDARRMRIVGRAPHEVLEEIDARLAPPLVL
jgi:mRNA interferase MazF